MAARKSESVSNLPKFTELNNLASSKNGASIVFATDDWFAAAENLLKEDDAEWKEGVFDDFGKWMDGWETRRKRIVGHDWAVIKLAYPGTLKGVDIDTSFFTGNYTPKVSIQAIRLSPQEESLIPPRTRRGNGQAASKEEFQKINMFNPEKWTTILEKTVLQPGYADTCHNYFEIKNNDTWTHLRLNMYPDGGIARFRVYGQVQRDLGDILNSKSNQNGLIDLIAAENGGICIGYTDAHFGMPRKMLQDGKSINMGDGWETARRLDRPEILTADKNGVLQVPGNEWAAFRLGVPGHIYKVVIETTHFQGNFPDSVRLEGCTIKSINDENKTISLDGAPWEEILPAKKMGPSRDHIFEEKDLGKCRFATHVRVRMAPDGGIARLRIWGKPEQMARI